MRPAVCLMRSSYSVSYRIERRFGLEGTIRPSLAFYNTPDEVDKMVSILMRQAR
ncbi:hypothetical protein AGMMS49992_34150 [Clostridia bacterium]|nr:hypothetical protein AGMMS49992_34150 [Clostridia bacterium]